MQTQTELETYLLSKKGAAKDFPFDETAACFRVMGKIFAISNITDDPPEVNLKCEPDWALALRDMYPAVQPGYHMNKKHWNTVTLDGSIPTPELLGMIDDSYNIIVKKLKKALREELAAME